MKIPSFPRHLVLAMSAAACLPMAKAADDKPAAAAAARSPAGSTINPGAAARHQREVELAEVKALVKSALMAVSDWHAACPGSPPKPRLTLQDPADTQLLPSLPAHLSLAPSFNPSPGQACIPGSNYLMLSAAHALLGANAWAVSNPEMASGLRFTSESAANLQRMQRGLANVMTAFKAPMKR